MSISFTIPTVSVDGKALDNAISVRSIDVVREVNRIPSAQIVLDITGDADLGGRLLGRPPFVTGGEIQVMARQDGGGGAPLFKGLVTGLAIRTDSRGATITLTAKDRAVKLTGVRRRKVWTKRTDDAVARALIGAAGLKAGELPKTAPEHATLVQYGATDWDFLLTRADAQGLVVVVEDGTVSLKRMAVDGKPNRSFARGADPIDDVEFELDATVQHAAVVGVAWDSKAVGPGKPSKADLLPRPQGGVGRAPVGSELGCDDCTLTHMVPMPEPEVASWARGRMARSRLALMRGRLSAQGMADLRLMEVAGIRGLGGAFDGPALVTAIHHRLDAGGFRTDVQFGLTPEPPGRLPDITDTAAAGLLPAASGLQLGTVAAIEADPDKEARVRILVPAIAPQKDAAVWARVAAPDAGDKRGIVFRPEVGDEVVVGFLDNDPRHPVVLGRLHGSKNPPPDGFGDASADKVKKGIVTRSGAAIVFADTDKPSITIRTPAGNRLLLDDDGKTLTLTDQHGNTIAMDDSGVTVKSVKDLKLEASGAVTIKGQSVDIN